MNDHSNRNGHPELQLGLQTVDADIERERREQRRKPKVPPVILVDNVTYFEASYLDAVQHGEVICYDHYGNGNWIFGIVSNGDRRGASIYNEVSENGVPSHTYGRGVCYGETVERLRFRMAEPSEYAGVEFSYGMTPGFRRH